MKTITVDYETYYDSEYSLRKVTPVEYILDPRFQMIGVAVKEDDGPSFWMEEPQWVDYLAELQSSGEKIAMVSHNALFDACITAWRFGYVPHIMIDTLGMSRAWLGHALKSLSLNSVAMYLGLGVKGDTVHKVQGMGLEAIKAAGFYGAYASYSCNDADLCWAIYRRLIEMGYPATEIAVMDTVLRCAVQPRFVLDQTRLAEHLHNIMAMKQDLLARCGLTSRDDLMSNDKFAEALRMLGVEPPTKISLTTGKETYAFSKTDPDFLALEDHEEPAVSALVAARLGVKSTIEETRTQRLISISNLTWGGNAQGLMPMPLRYSGAHTHRLCLVGGTMVSVLRDNQVVCTRLDNLRADDFVWDGEEFVAHGGLSFAGLKKVITYDEITGTPDHRVWTVEHGYQELATAKARGYHIARGGVPDPSRINPALFRTNQVSYESPVHMLSVRERSVLDVEGLAEPGSRLVQILCSGGENGRGIALSSNAECGGEGERRCYSSASGVTSESIGYPPGEALGEVAGEDTVSALGLGALEDRIAHSGAGTSALPEPEGIELRVLWRSGDRVPICFDAHHGGLALGEPWAKAAGDVLGSDRLHGALRTWESPLGFEEDSVGKQVFQPTWDIVDCGPRNRFMANGRIVHNSGDWKLNMQNLPSRGNTAIREAIKAPPGYVVLACDASQIEARIAAWFAGQTNMVEAFANGEDIYSDFASKVFGYPVSKKENKVERFIGKTCLAEGTLLLTDQGLVPIQNITPSHRLWDGEEWICHSGVVENGLKKTLQLSGIWLTPDHLVLCGTQWREAALVKGDANLHYLALATGAENLPSLVTSQVTAVVSRRSSSGATVDVQSSLLTDTISKTSRAHGVLNAGTLLATPSVTGSMLLRSLTTHIARAFSTGSLLRLPAATAPMTPTTGITAGAASPYTSSGVTTVPRFSGTRNPCPDGITQLMTWIASTWTRLTSRAISGSSVERRMPVTSARYLSSKNVSGSSKRVYRVFDVANAGPRHRFTVMTDDGPMIVHNCILGLQYGLGWTKFQKTVALQSKSQVGQEIKLSDEDASRIVSLYRNTYSSIPKIWRTLSDLIPKMTSPALEQVLHPVTFEHERVRLPSGLFLNYHKLNNRNGQWWFEYGGAPKYIYGGKMLENIVQSLARICVMDAAVRIRREAPALQLHLQVHDELVYVVPEDYAESAKAIVMEQMRTRPVWGQDIPLDCEAGIGPSYGDAK